MHTSTVSEFYLGQRTLEPWFLKSQIPVLRKICSECPQSTQIFNFAARGFTWKEHSIFQRITNIPKTGHAEKAWKPQKLHISNSSPNSSFLPLMFSHWHMLLYWWLPHLMSHDFGHMVIRSSISSQSTNCEFYSLQKREEARERKVAQLSLTVFNVARALYAYYQLYSARAPTRETYFVMHTDSWYTTQCTLFPSLAGQVHRLTSSQQHNN